MSGENTSSGESSVSTPKYANISKFQKHDRDGGSCEVQVSILTQRLEYLALHFKMHPQDTHSQRGMQRMINQRKKLLAYLRKSDLSSYKNVIAELGIRK